MCSTSERNQDPRNGCWGWFPWFLPSSHCLHSVREYYRFYFLICFLFSILPLWHLHLDTNLHLKRNMVQVELLTFLQVFSALSFPHLIRWHTWDHPSSLSCPHITLLIYQKVLLEYILILTILSPPLIQWIIISVATSSLTSVPDSSPHPLQTILFLYFFF